MKKEIEVIGQYKSYSRASRFTSNRVPFLVKKEPPQE